MKIMRSAFCIILACAFMFLLCACGNKPAIEEPQETEIEEIVLETKYATLRYPKTYENKLIHKEVVQDAIAMEIFSAVLDGEEWELFRIYFNDISMGSHVGYIIKGAEEIPVSYYVCEYDSEDFATEQVKAEYYSLMDGFNAVVNSIYDNVQFSKEKMTKPVEQQEVTLEYWSVVLPENIYWEEFHTDGLYRVDFYGLIQDERVDLYSIGLGEMEGDYSVGAFLVGDEMRTIHVRIYEVPENYNWSEEDYNSIYRMLETVNTLVDTIMLDENYVETPAE